MKHSGMACYMIQVKLTFLNGCLKDRKFQFRGEISIGRAETNTICVAEPSVSSNHCLIFRRSGVPCIKDLVSTNGTSINANPVEVAEIHDGDIVTVGDVHFLVQFIHAGHTTDASSTPIIELHHPSADEVKTERIVPGESAPRPPSVNIIS